MLMLVAKLKRDHGVRMALLAYDIIPVRRPGIVRPFAYADLFKGWFDEVLPLCDTIFAISRSAAGDA